jgi:hypothetical protein
MKMDLKKHDEYSLIKPQEIYYCETVLQKVIGIIYILLNH